MKDDRFTANWPEIRRRVQAHWNRLTDDDFGTVQGNMNTLIDMIAQKYEEPRQAIKLQLEHLLEQIGGEEPAATRMDRKS